MSDNLIFYNSLDTLRVSRCYSRMTVSVSRQCLSTSQGYHSLDFSNSLVSARLWLLYLSSSSILISLNILIKVVSSMIQRLLFFTWQQEFLNIIVHSVQQLRPSRVGFTHCSFHRQKHFTFFLVGLILSCVYAVCKLF